MTVYKLRHTTRYEYEAPVLHAHHSAHLRPRKTDNQVVQASCLEVSPAPQSIRERTDYFGNPNDVIELSESHDCFEVTARSRVSVAQNLLSEAPPLGIASWEEVASVVAHDPMYLAEHELALDSPLVLAHRMLRQYASSVFTPDRDVAEAIIELNRRINADFAYVPSSTEVSVPLGVVMRERRGVCQDFAHVAVGCLRSFGLPARYVSGYLETSPPPGKPRLVGADASHAWAAAFIPGAGWLDFDPTNNVLPSNRHVTVGWGRDFSDVSPLKGVVLGGGQHTVTVAVDVEPMPPQTQISGLAQQQAQQQ